MKKYYLAGEIFMLALSLFSAFIAYYLEYHWVTDASMQHKGVKWAGVLLCLVCSALVGACIAELFKTIKGEE